MKLPEEIKHMLDKEVKRAVKETLGSNGLFPSEPALEKSKKLQEASKPKGLSILGKTLSSLREALVLIPKSFLLKTEKLSDVTKHAHEVLYKGHVEAFNKISIGLDAANPEEAKSTTSALRDLKVDETYNMNAVKLHELYFANVSDMASEISVDSIPFMRLARDFGTFERWQRDFIGCALSSRNGWAITVYEPYKNVYMNVVVDEHHVGVPIGSVPVIVLDMWEHAFYKDYASEKKTYIHAMMRELNWSVIEARMAVAEKSGLTALYMIQPVVNDAPEAMLSAAEKAQEVPIQNVNPTPGSITQTPPVGGPGALAPNNPPAPAMTPGFERPRG